MKSSLIEIYIVLKKDCKRNKVTNNIDTNAEEKSHKFEINTNKRNTNSFTKENINNYKNFRDEIKIKILKKVTQNKLNKDEK